MSRYKPYPAYKDSGVEWLGKVPEHWKVCRLATVGSLCKGNGGTKADDTDEGVPCIRYGDLYTAYDFLVSNIKKYIRDNVSDNYTKIKFGDLLFAGSGETLEEIGKSVVNLDRREARCGGDVIILRPYREFDSTFLAYAAGAAPSQIQKSLMGKGFTVIHIYSEDLRNLIITEPPQSEQKTIGRAIAHETTIIDTLIAKTKHSIDILKERRSAFITAAVTGQIDLRDNN